MAVHQTRICDIVEKVHTIAPPETAMSFDNVGLLIGDPNAVVHKVLLALDVTKDVLQQAAAMQAQLIISHHPVIFQPCKRLLSDSLPYQAVSSGIAVLSAHTNYDLAVDGVNACLAKTLGLQNIRPYHYDKASGLPEGLLGTLPEAMTPEAFASHVKTALHCGGVTYTKGDHPVREVAVGCGAGSYLLFDAMEAGADGFVVGESKHHELLAAKEAGLTMVTAGHFSTENPAMLPLLHTLQQAFPEVAFLLAEQADPVSYL